MLARNGTYFPALITLMETQHTVCAGSHARDDAFYIENTFDLLLQSHSNLMFIFISCGNAFGTHCIFSEKTTLKWNQGLQHAQFSPLFAPTVH